MLFFYCELLDKSPFETARQEVCSLYKDIYTELTTRYQVFLPEDMDVSIPTEDDTHWHKFRSSIYCMAIFSFFYSLLVLFIIGIEGHKVYGAYHQALQVTNSLALIYYVLNTAFYRSFLGQSRLLAIVYAAVLGAYIPFHFAVSSLICLGDAWGQSLISAYTLLASVFGLILILFHLLIDGYTIYRCKRSVKRIRKHFDVWTQLPFNKVPRKAKWVLVLDSIKSLLSEKSDLQDSKRKVLEDYLKRRVKNELKFLKRKLS